MISSAMRNPKYLQCGLVKYYFIFVWFQYTKQGARKIAQLPIIYKANLWAHGILFWPASLFLYFRQLFSSSVRDSVCALDGLLPHPSLHPLQSNRHHIVGLFLAESRCHACQSRPWCYHCADHDHPNGLYQRGPAKDILCQVHRCLPGRMFLHGVRFSIR